MTVASEARLRNCALLARRTGTGLGITIPAGLRCGKLLAKLAPDLNKPRGFAVIGRTEAKAFLAERPLEAPWGAGRALRKRPAADGLRTIGELRPLAELAESVPAAVARTGEIGPAAAG